MSTHKQIYIGPYLKIRCPQVEVMVEGPRLCCDTKYSNFQTFCGKCGVLLDKRMLPEMRDKVSRGDIAQVIGEYLSSSECEDGCHYWRPNRGGSNLQLDIESSGAYEFPLMSEKVAAFTREYKPQIDEMSAAYGTIGEVRYGVLVWWS